MIVPTEVENPTSVQTAKTPPSITEEIDKPFDKEAGTHSDVYTIGEIEKGFRQQKHDHYVAKFKYKTSLGLIITCLGLCILLSVGHSLLMSYEIIKNDDLIKSVFEVVKLLLTTLTGYLFAKSETN